MGTSKRTISGIAVGTFFIFYSSAILSAPVPYEVIQNTNTSLGSQRARANITIIAPAAQDKTSRIDTVKQSIEDTVKKTDAVVVTAQLVPSKALLGAGALLAKGEYYADGCGPSGSTCDGTKLKLSATDIKLSPKAVRIWEQSVKSTNELAEKGIFEDEKITADVAKKLKIKTSEVDVPYIELEPAQEQ